MIYHTRDEHTNHYTTDVVKLKKKTYEPVYTVSIYHILTIFQENCNTELFQTVRDWWGVWGLIVCSILTDALFSVAL